MINIIKIKVIQKYKSYLIPQEPFPPRVAFPQSDIDQLNLTRSCVARGEPRGPHVTDWIAQKQPNKRFNFEINHTQNKMFNKKT